MHAAFALSSFLLLNAALPQVNVAIDTSEPEMVLKIADAAAEHQTVSERQWRELFTTPGYRDLKAREAAFQRPFTDDDFRAFVLSPNTIAARTDLRRTLEQWKKFDVSAAASRALRYLPDGTPIAAVVYPVIKPKTNSFVFRTGHGKAIFLYLDPAVSGAKFENTVVHELHHIGYDAACPQPPDLSTPVATARLYLGGFGEGLAVLAAAGDARTHPHAVSDAKERAVWDRDVANVGDDMKKLEAFFLSILDGTVKGDSAVNDAFMKFISTEDVPQGAFYTVGWSMAATIEQAEGRGALVSTICDPVGMMRRYNAIARREGRPVWSAALLDALDRKR